MEELNVRTYRGEELLEQLLEGQRKQIKYEKIKFVLACIALVLGVIALIASLSTFKYVKEQMKTLSEQVMVTAESVNEVAEKLKVIDFKAIEESYQTLVTMATETVEQIEKETRGINDLINKALKTLEDADEVFASISEIDFETLNKGIKDFTDVLAPLSNWFKLLGK